MTNSGFLQEDGYRFANEMEKYLVQLEKQRKSDEKTAYKNAMEDLISTGVLSKKGETKVKIVSWD